MKITIEYLDGKTKVLMCWQIIKTVDGMIKFCSMSGSMIIHKTKIKKIDVKL